MLVTCGPVVGEMRGHGQQQRAGTRDHNALALDRKSTLDQRLQTTCSEDAGKSPAGEGQESLARSGRNDQTVVVERDRLWRSPAFRVSA